MITLVVAAAVIERNGRFLVTRRQPGVHLAGSWEFPGGKCDAGESLAACMARELREELAVEARVGRELFTTTHAYPERCVELHFLQCELRGDPSAHLGQDMRWVTREELRSLEFPPADTELINLLTEG
jgi:8-oxo-dGTP diphosphatase